jgi:hypothetical protein
MILNIHYYPCDITFWYIKNITKTVNCDIIFDISDITAFLEFQKCRLVGDFFTFDSTILSSIYLAILMWGMKHFDNNLTEISIRLNKLESESRGLKISEDGKDKRAIGINLYEINQS